jgi:hypothetical protein
VHAAGMMRSMSPEAELYARISLVVPFAMIGLLVYALFRRYHGRSVPAWTQWSGAFLTGFALSSPFIFFITEPIWLVLGSVPLLWIAWLLARSGRRRLAGLAILGLALPGAVWWGRFLVEDALNPFSLYDEVLLLWWLPAMAGVIVAVALIVAGDRRDRVARVMKRPPNAVRDPMALGNALGAAVSFGPFPMPSVIAELVAFLVTIAVVSVGALLGVPWWVALLGGAMIYMVVSTELWYLAFPRRARPAWETFAYVGSAEQARWRRETGSPVPNTEGKIHAWLRNNEERPETRWAHAELLALVGRLEEARAMAERIEPTTPAQEFERLMALDYIDWIDGAQIDHAARFRAAELIGSPESEERLMARGMATHALARARAEAGGDWMGPMNEFQRDIAGIGWARLRADTHRQRMVLTFLLGLVLAGLATVPVLILQP